mmetsp:Transcript_17267/g.51697  ORF Transcript_17267/g.51697 Transcript_17267/m.51697 type:complete len:203 (-) Transcript_17267:2169-2777(-)
MLLRYPGPCLQEISQPQPASPQRHARLLNSRDCHHHRPHHHRLRHRYHHLHHPLHRYLHRHHHFRIRHNSRFHHHSDHRSLQSMFCRFRSNGASLTASCLHGGAHCPPPAHLDPPAVVVPRPLERCNSAGSRNQATRAVSCVRCHGHGRYRWQGHHWVREYQMRSGGEWAPWYKQRLQWTRRRLASWHSWGLRHPSGVVRRP